jgi:hypothetical protein
MRATVVERVVLSVDAVALQLWTKTAFCCACHNWVARIRRWPLQRTSLGYGRGLTADRRPSGRTGQFWLSPAWLAARHSRPGNFRLRANSAPTGCH